MGIFMHVTYRRAHALISPQGLIIQDALMKQVMIKVGVVSLFARQQRESVVQFDRRSSRASTRTQQWTRVLCHDTRFCAVMPVVFSD